MRYKLTEKTPPDNMAEAVKWLRGYVSESNEAFRELALYAANTEHALKAVNNNLNVLKAVLSEVEKRLRDGGL